MDYESNRLYIVLRPDVTINGLVMICIDAISKSTRLRTSFYGTNRPKRTRVAVSTGPNRNLLIWAIQEILSNPTSPMDAAWPVPSVCHASVDYVANRGNLGLAGANAVTRAYPVRGTAGACPLIVIMHLSHNWQKRGRVRDVRYVRSERRVAIIWFVLADMNGAMSVSVIGMYYIINVWIEMEIDRRGCVLYLEIWLEATNCGTLC